MFTQLLSDVRIPNGGEIFQDAFFVRKKRHDHHLRRRILRTFDFDLTF